jgi:hypothetical protein
MLPMTEVIRYLKVKSVYAVKRYVSDPERLFWIRTRQAQQKVSSGSDQIRKDIDLLVQHWGNSVQPNPPLACLRTILIILCFCCSEYQVDVLRMRNSLKDLKARPKKSMCVYLHCIQMNNHYFSSQFVLKKMKHPTSIIAKMLTFCRT